MNSTDSDTAPNSPFLTPPSKPAPERPWDEHAKQCRDAVFWLRFKAVMTTAGATVFSSGLLYSLALFIFEQGRIVQFRPIGLLPVGLCFAVLLWPGGFLQYKLFVWEHAHMSVSEFRESWRKRIRGVSGKPFVNSLLFACISFGLACPLLQFLQHEPAHKLLFYSILVAASMNVVACLPLWKASIARIRRSLDELGSGK